MVKTRHVQFNADPIEPVKRTDTIERRFDISTKTIESLIDSIMDIYTNGSAKGANQDGGAGAWIQDTGQINLFTNSKSAIQKLRTRKSTNDKQSHDIW